MERYLLDTNIVMFLLMGELGYISRDTRERVFEYGNDLTTISIVVMEFVQLHRIGRISSKKYKTAMEMAQAIEKDLYIRVLPFGREHAHTLSKLEISEGHNDPFDHSIISHAITENFTLVSSDRKFKDYESCGLKFFFNKR